MKGNPPNDTLPDWTHGTAEFTSSTPLSVIRRRLFQRISLFSLRCDEISLYIELLTYWTGSRQLKLITNTVRLIYCQRCDRQLVIIIMSVILCIGTWCIGLILARALCLAGYLLLSSSRLVNILDRLSANLIWSVYSTYVACVFNCSAWKYPTMLLWRLTSVASCCKKAGWKGPGWGSRGVLGLESAWDDWVVHVLLTLWRPLVAIWVYGGYAFNFFDIRALWRSGLSVRVPGCQKLQMTA